MQYESDLKLAYLNSLQDEERVKVEKKVGLLFFLLFSFLYFLFSYFAFGTFMIVWICLCFLFLNYILTLNIVIYFILR